MFRLDGGPQLETEGNITGSIAEANPGTGTPVGTLPRHRRRTIAGMLVLGALAVFVGIATLGVGLWTGGGSESLLVDTGGCIVMADPEQGVVDTSTCSASVDSGMETPGGVHPAGSESAPSWRSVLNSTSVHVPIPRLWVALAGRLLSPAGGP